MKVGKKKKKTESFYILGYRLELIKKVWRLAIFFLSKSGEFGSFFVLEKSFV
jgi:hypothetical protein